MRRLLFAAGLVTLIAAWLGPLPGLARGSFSAHMALHMAVVALGAPLLAFGVAGSHLDPARHHPLIFQALPASIGDLIVVWAWHLPALHHAARQSTWLLAAEQATFFAAALWLWLAAAGGGRDNSRRGAGVFALLFTLMHMTLLGALLGLGRRPLYGHDLDALADQQWGGAIMILGTLAAYLTGGLALMSRVLHDPANRRPRAVDL